jgi:hypothetical protein
MPAAELSRLRAQINQLIERFADPAGLRSELRDLLDLYANRAYRAGQAVQPQPLLHTYRVPPLIMQQLTLELSKTCQEQPQRALEVVELLWQDPSLEPRLLATSLLGAIPVSEGSGVIEKLRAWVQPGENFRILEALFQHGTLTLRKYAPELLLTLFEEWISSPQKEMQALGVRALVPLVNDPAFETLPAVFRLLSPLVQSAPAPLHTDLQAILEALARRIPTETAYFLRQMLGLASGQGTARLVRRCLPLFSPAQQASLRSAIETARSS